MPSLGNRLRLGDDVARALEHGGAVVGLETAVLTHGLPEPQNLSALRAMMAAVEGRGAVPAVCLTLAGELWIGAGWKQIETVARAPHRIKVGVDGLAAALVANAPGGLTVSGTLAALQARGIRVFATGGIGGVHAGVQETGDVSADLHQLARSTVIVVTAGAKSILDIPRTAEYLETLGIPVLGYRSSTLAGFYLTSSGLSIRQVESVTDIAEIARVHWALGAASGVLVSNPLQAAEALEQEGWQGWLDEAHRQARAQGVHGKDVTPFLLEQVGILSEGRTIEANLRLLRHNAEVAAEVAVAL
ncbi:MAG: pseudouridine-5'-phosphate glycosidase [Chloroflexota bacterium]